MAVLTLSANMPAGLRLRALFSSIVNGAITFGIEEGRKTASFQVNIHNFPVDIVYGGPITSEAQGEVSYMRVGPTNSPWLTYGDLSGEGLFTYSDLLTFQAQRAAAAAVVMAGNDHLIGSWQGDYLEGYAGNDRLDGGAGADTLDGGSGNDTYIVDHKDDRIFEVIGGGYDVVWTSANFAMAPDAEIEELRAVLSTYSLALAGNGFRNLIVGTSGNDEIDGKGGVDTLIGGAGNDLYIVDDAFDMVSESDGEGYDTVIAEVSYRLADYIEALKAAGGSASINLIGNALSNEIIGNLGANRIEGLDGNDHLYGDGGNDSIYGGNGQDMIFGGMGSDQLDGGEGSDTLYGDIGNDILEGSSGHDSLYGGAGDDSLHGSDGNDWLYGDVGRDVIDGGAGNDRLYGGTGNNKLLGQSGHDTIYGGMHADTLQAGAGNDKLYGDVGHDLLGGGAGSDTLSGGWGKDVIIFKDRLNAKTNVDTILDFNVRDDTIWLDNIIFRNLGKSGRINPEVFIIGSKPQDANDYLIYNKSNGRLYYDADGSGANYKSIPFAKLKPGLSLTDKDFYII